MLNSENGRNISYSQFYIEEKKVFNTIKIQKIDETVLLHNILFTKLNKAG